MARLEEKNRAVGLKIGGRLRSVDASLHGADLEIPPFNV